MKKKGKKYKQKEEEAKKQVRLCAKRARITNGTGVQQQTKQVRATSELVYNACAQVQQARKGRPKRS